MKVALCISGQPRNVYRGVQNILENMKFDFEVFVHAWWDNDSNKDTFRSCLKIVSYDLFSTSYIHSLL